jgi:hypothetical protein
LPAAKRRLALATDCQDVHVRNRKALLLSNLPRSPRRRGSAPANDDASISTIGRRIPLSKRLPGMTDHQLTAHHRAAVRISGEKGHAQHAIAQHALPLIETEIRRRTTEPAASPAKQNRQKEESE